MTPKFDKSKEIAVKLATKIQRYKGIKTMLDMKLEMDQVKVLGVELADILNDSIFVACQYGFPKQKGKVFAKVCIDLKGSINRTESEADLNKYVQYLLTQFGSLTKILGIR
ncbi:hypothetical protein LCGC14_1717450 [marine sediment metagenome]|uniref:Uncharacterized protein n=1 Tax=marine sediment metagenome TaxID=412755 RepID=A0A0F9HDP4_9ZZZZ